MALFKIEKGLAASLATARPTTNEGWCYFTKDDGKFYIDIETGNDLTKRVCLNANTADKLTVSAGDINTPVYFKDGIPVPAEVKLDNKADAVQHKTGNIITANNSAYTPIKGLKLYGKTIQNGTPTPETPVPLESVGADGNVAVTVCGGNLFHNQRIGEYSVGDSGLLYAALEDGRYVLTGTYQKLAVLALYPSNIVFGDHNYMDAKTLFKIKKGQTVYISALQLVYKTASGKLNTIGGGVTIPKVKDAFAYTAQEDLEVLQLRILSSASATYGADIVWEPSVSFVKLNSYEPYKEQTLTANAPNGLPGIPVTSGGNYTDENGQMWICDEIDFARGKYVQRIYGHTFTDSDVDYLQFGESTAGNTFTLGVGFTRDHPPILVDETIPCVMSDVATGIAYKDRGGKLFFYVYAYGGNHIVFRDSTENTVNFDAFKAGLSGKKIAYALATPIETDLTAEELAQYSALHTNSSYTTIYNDFNANMELTYYTPTTAVQMVHSPSDEGKILGIDEHGCVVLQKGSYLPLSAGEDNKLAGPLGLTENVMYSTTLPQSGFNGQLFFLEEDDGSSLPSGGTAGQYLVKNSSADGDASWKNLPDLNYLPLTGGTVNGDISVDQLTITNTSGVGHINFSRVSSYNYIYLPSGESQAGKIAVCIGPTLGSTESQIIIDKTSIIPGTTGTINLGTSSKKWNMIYGSQVYGAVWNDYAEYRSQTENIEPGYCVFSADNGSVSKTTEKFQACDGIVSDTFGFAIGETDECQTPLAVAGRVLAYCEGDRYSYHAGDTVCAGPDGKVVKMSREEIREWPDRIVGIVSEIPNYDTWGTGNIKVNNRIWIKIK